MSRSLGSLIVNYSYFDGTYLGLRSSLSAYNIFLMLEMTTELAPSFFKLLEELCSASILSLSCIIKLLQSSRLLVGCTISLKIVSSCFPIFFLTGLERVDLEGQHMGIEMSILDSGDEAEHQNY